MCLLPIYKPTEVNKLNYPNWTGCDLVEFLYDSGHYIFQTISLVRIKSLFAVAVYSLGYYVNLATEWGHNFYTLKLGGSITALIFLFVAMIFDLFWGCKAAWKCGCLDISVISKTITKLTVYGTCIVLVGIAIRSILTPFGLNWPILDLFVAFMIATEVLSVFDNMDRAGRRPPEFAYYFVLQLRALSRCKAEEYFKKTNYDRRNSEKEQQKDEQDT